MQRLLAFFYQYRVFGFFLLLEIVCAWLFISYNNYYNASFLNSSNFLSATIQTWAQNTTDYARLDQVNARLVEENRQLRRELYRINALPTTKKRQFDSFEVVDAGVVNNTYRRSENYFTLNKGSSEGIEPGMGVIVGQGVAGITKSVSSNFSTVTSLLNQNLMVSSEIKNSKTLCTVQWDAADPLYSELKYVPRHIPLQYGDTVVTSGFNSIFPSGILIGHVDYIELPKESPFYIAKVRLATDFTSLDYAYIIRQIHRNELDSLASYE